MELDPAGVRELRDGDSVVDGPRHVKYLNQHDATRKFVEREAI